MMRTLSHTADDNYIFISYSHKDANRAASIFNGLIANHFHIWYDTRIEAGSLWSDNIAHHIENCTCFIALMSKNYLDSSNCLDELNYARDQEKSRLIIYLEDTTLPSGMAMRFNRSQAVNFYADESFETLYPQLLDLKDIQTCQELLESTPPASPSGDYPASYGTVPARKPLVLLVVIGALFIGCIGGIFLTLNHNQSHINDQSGINVQVTDASDESNTDEDDTQDQTATVDPFDSTYFNVVEDNGLYIKYQGIYPDGYLTIINNLDDENPLSNITYTLSNINVAPGDIVTITAESYDSMITLSRSTMDYTVPRLPHYLTSPAELTQDQLERLMDILHKYCEADDSDIHIYDGTQDLYTKGGETTYLEISKNALLYINENERAELILIIDRSIDTDFYYENGDSGHELFNTLIGACRFSSLYVDNDGDIQYMSSDPTYMQIYGYYTSDKVFEDLYLNDVDEELGDEGYTRYALYLN